MDIVLGVSMEPTAVRLLLIEGENADGVIVEEDNFEVGTGDCAATSDAAAQVIAAITGTREGAAESGYQLTSIGVTWTDPAGVAALRAELAARDIGSVMLVSPLLAAAALAHTIGVALDYRHIAMLFVEAGSATLAVVDVADGSIVDLHRQSFEAVHELATMVAGLDAPGSRSDGVFVIGCGVDIVGIKSLLEAATSLVVTGPEEPHMALARGAALASANAPLFASSTAALAYALDPGTGEVHPGALNPTYLDLCANADPGREALAYSALDDEPDEVGLRPRRPLVLSGGAMAGISAIAAGVLIVSLTSDVRETAAVQLSPPASEAPSQVQLPAPSSLPPAPAAPVAETAPPPAPPAPPPVVAAPPPAVSPPPEVRQPPQTATNMAPATQPRRAPTRQAPPPVRTPVQQAPPPAPPPAAVPAPPPEPPVQPTPIMTMYLHVPFLTIPIPIYPPPPPPPPPPPGPPEPGP
ncbi:DUF7159 family protein [Mycobacterium riyadhense]|uniref:DUF7159 domain-containing protein n=1 Tax=Mycobacterium riyadhense TaxID=486698 RepID=A0A1X2DHN2_9MYCO|nr:hypothetical protein [Mycobacterium riyadhense]MCV7149576.1 hypothetical protein [Mycobacterium riyadhense]ORW87484.1 hypothetical protein AWC22_08760 [Mycobacterium riyadhense]